MQIIISILIIGLLWMIYDLINAPEVDDDENYILPPSDDENDEVEVKKHIIDEPQVKKEGSEIEEGKKTSKIE